MAENSRSQVWACRTASGYLIRVNGHGTMRESLAVHEFADGFLGENGVTLTIDLNACQFLDSTFLGCLVSLHKRCEQKTPQGFRVAASEQKVKALLEPTRIHTLFSVTEDSEDVVGECVAITSEVQEPRDLGRHIMKCHRQLADIDGPDQDVFQRIADRLARELGE